jgi:methanogenic corrinoid protein MtbC1
MITEEKYKNYLQHLLDGQKADCKRIVSTILDTDIEIKELYERLFQRSLYRVGELWEQNRISVAVEHLATSITEGLLHLVYPKIFAAEHHGKKAVVSCVANEYHQVGAKMVADIFELNGWDGYFLGANTPVDDLLQLIDEKSPDMLGLSLSIYFNTARLIEVIEEVRGAYPQLDILVGGQAFRWGGANIVKAYPRLQYIASLQQLEKMLREA